MHVKYACKSFIKWKILRLWFLRFTTGFYWSPFFPRVCFCCRMRYQGWRISHAVFALLSLWLSGEGLYLTALRSARSEATRGTRRVFRVHSDRGRSAAKSSAYEVNDVTVGRHVISDEHGFFIHCNNGELEINYACSYRGNYCFNCEPACLLCHCTRATVGNLRVSSIAYVRPGKLHLITSSDLWTSKSFVIALLCGARRTSRRSLTFRLRELHCVLSSLTTR